jgi:hypothetical protein
MTSLSSPYDEFLRTLFQGRFAGRECPPAAKLGNDPAGRGSLFSARTNARRRAGIVTGKIILVIGNKSKYNVAVRLTGKGFLSPSSLSSLLSDTGF